MIASPSRFLSLASVVVLAASCSGGEGSDDASVSSDGTSTVGGWPACVAPEPFAPVQSSYGPVTEEYGVGEEEWLVLRAIPENPRAVLFYFHGTDTSRDDIKHLEITAGLSVLYDTGIGIVATSCADRDSKQWDTFDADWDDNADLVHLDLIRNGLIADGRMTAETPLVFSGFSKGGGFAGFFTEQATRAGWPVAATSIHNSGGFLDPDTGVPIWWASAANDPTAGPEEMQANFNAYREAGNRCEYHEADEIAVVPERFLRIYPYTEEQSQATFDELVDLAMIDANGVALVDPLNDIESVMEQYHGASQRTPDTWEVDAQLRVIWATHRYDSRFAYEECLFVSEVVDSFVP